MYHDPSNFLSLVSHTVYVNNNCHLPIFLVKVVHKSLVYYWLLVFSLAKGESIHIFHLNKWLSVSSGFLLLDHFGSAFRFLLTSKSILLLLRSSNNFVCNINIFYRHWLAKIAGLLLSKNLNKPSLYPCLANASLTCLRGHTEQQGSGHADGASDVRVRMLAWLPCRHPKVTIA